MARNKRNVQPPAPSARFGSECASPEIAPPAAAGNCAADLVGPAVSCKLGELRAGETLVLRYGRERARFIVAWVGAPGTSHEGHVGLKGLPASQHIWDVAVTRNSNAGHAAEPELELVRLAARRGSGGGGC
jgi:hypothetical protein